MKKWFGFMLLSVILLLAACNKNQGTPSEHGSVDDGESANGYGSIDHGIDEKKVGFSLTGDTIEEAANVPAEEKERILNVFNVYIDAFNEKDIERYMGTLSKQSESFDKVGERAELTDVFSQYDIKREPSDVTIVKYDEKEAQVFAKLSTSMTQLSSGLVTNPNGRQVTVFTKDDGEWKVSSVYYIGDEEKK